ncbi:MAG: M48 family metallopeptidase [Bdellovibrionales bacterium]|nr:M48 family metallopeptidase [Bdellovibrionales bacterium]
MTADHIFLLYAVCFCAYFLTELALNFLNIGNAKRHASEVPIYFRDWTSQEDYQRSVAYTLEKQYFSIVNLLFSSFVLIACIVSGFFGVLDSWMATLGWGPYITGCAYLFSLGFLSSLVRLPLDYYSRFSIEQRFGFNTMTIGLWLVDFLKSFILQLVIGFPVLLCLFWIIDILGVYWWIYGFLFVAGIQLVLLFLFPVFIAPLFNKFEKLQEQSLRERIFELAEKAGFKTSGIFVMDGSKRSNHGNAYFTGFGRYKRIVLFDTLVELLKEQEVLAVLAHEIGHEKMNHIKKMLFVSISVLFVGFWILSVMMDYEPLFQAFGFQQTSAHGALVLVGFIFEPVLFFITPLFSSLSRKHEFEADRFAVDLVGSSDDLRKALLALSGKSLSNLVPHPLFCFFHYSHPSLSERLPAMEVYAASKAASA